MSLPVTPVKSRVHSALSMEHGMNYDINPNIPYSHANELAIPRSKDLENGYGLRRNGNKAKKSHTHSQSQVRFSIPDPDELSQNSPLKIVFPKSGNDTDRTMSTSSLLMSSHGHLVDMHSKILVNVPEEVWRFHHNRKKKSENKHRRTHSDFNSNTNAYVKSSNHSRSKSLQSIIVDTMNTYRAIDADTTANENISNISQVSPLNIPFDKPPPLTPEKNLYLTPESPLNRYHLPVPLEISLPPYLSPQNKHKQRNSLVYDGDGYSEFRESNDSSSTEPSLEQPSSSYSDENNSIPYAHHDVSFELNNADPDKFLGIDENANVNLKIQRRNLRNLQHTKKETGSKRGQENPEKNESLKILSTPNKLIDIPDLDHIRSPPSTGLNGTLKFFQQFEPYEEPASPTHNINAESQDKLDMSFKFPSSTASKNTDNVRANRDSVSTNNEDFLKIDTSPVNQSFESRRQMLMDLQKSPTNKDPRMHQHRRSRSVHNIDDSFLTFEATSTPPAPASAPTFTANDSTPHNSPEIPKRSPLRFKSSPNTSDTSSNIQSPNTGSFCHEISIPSIEIVADETISPTLEQSIAKCPEKEYSEPFLGRDTDQSIAIIGETKSNSPAEPFKPLSSFNSFGQPIQNAKLVPLNQVAVDLAIKQTMYVTPRSAPLNNVSPKRQLSNSGSSKSSSYNSEFSAATTVTDATSQPSVAINKSNLSQNPKTKKKPTEHGGFCSPPQKNNLSFPRKKVSPTEKNDFKFNTIYEERNGKMVEVILLDEDEDIVTNTPRSKNIQAQEAKYEQQKKSPSNYYEVLDMCEKTADEAKKIIYQLMNETNGYPKKGHPQKQNRSRVLPPLPFPLYDKNGNYLITNKYKTHIHNHMPSEHNNLK